MSFSSSYSQTESPYSGETQARPGHTRRDTASGQESEVSSVDSVHSYQGQHAPPHIMVRTEIMKNINILLLRSY